MNTEINMPVISAVNAAREQTGVRKQENADPVEKSKSESPAQSIKDVEEVVTDLNSLVQNLQRDLLFSVDEKSGDTFVRVLDTQTDEVIREIPSKEIRELKARLEETAGIIFKDSV